MATASSSKSEVVSYLSSRCEDFDAAVVADVGGRVQQLLDVVEQPVQLEVGGHRVLTRPEDKHVVPENYSHKVKSNSSSGRTHESDWTADCWGAERNEKRNKSSVTYMKLDSLVESISDRPGWIIEPVAEF